MRAVELQTGLGIVRGTGDEQVQSFLGIPYAQPPVADLRFEVPQGARPWDGVRDATVPGPNAPHRLNDFPGLDTVPIVGRALSAETANCVGEAGR